MEVTPWTGLVGSNQREVREIGCSYLRATAMKSPTATQLRDKPHVEGYFTAEAYLVSGALEDLQ